LNCGAGLGRCGFGFGRGLGLDERGQLGWLNSELSKAAVRADQNGRENKDVGTVDVFEDGDMDEHLYGKFNLSARST